MISTRLKRMLRVGLLAGCITVMGCTSILVYADPSREELEKQTDGLENELNNLNKKLNTLNGELEDLSSKMEETSSAMKVTQEKMKEAQARGEEQYEAMKLRIKYMYEAGNTSFIELLCSAEDMADFLNKTDFIQNVSEYDREMLQELEDTQNEIKKEGDTLKKQQEELADMQEQVNATRTELENEISSKSSELEKYKDQLQAAKEAEALLAQQKAAEEAARQAQQNAAQDAQQGSSGSGSGGSNVSTDGKQSLGRFKITHYCSCFYCTGSWGGSHTASGTVPTAGRTIAVDPSVIPLGSQVIINGHVYTAEDTGGAIKGNKIDIFVSDHATALAYGVYYAEVYRAN